MKLLLSRLALLTAAKCSFAQTNTFPFNSYNSYIRIGTASPNAVLQVFGTMSTSGAYIQNVGPAIENLSYLAKFNKHQHLPQMHSEQEVIQKAIYLSEMNKLLIKVICNYAICFFTVLSSSFIDPRTT